MPNGCSGFQWITRWFDPITKCCNAHDEGYDYSGIPKMVVDESFFFCLQQIDPTIAAIGLGLVSAFGWMFYKRKKSHDPDQ